MSEPQRKQAQRKSRRGRRRSPAQRKREDETAAKQSSESTEQTAEAKADPPANAKADPPVNAKAASATKPAPQKEPAAKGKDDKDAEAGSDGDANVSSLLETSGQEVKQLLEAADEAAAKIREAAQAGEAEGESQHQERGEAISLISRTNMEVQKVLDAAEDAGEKIREEARLEARQLIDETRRQTQSAAGEQMDKVSRMTEQLLGELGGVQERLDSLRGAFDEAMQKMGGELAPPQTEVWEAKNGAVEEAESADLRKRLGRRRKMVPQKEPEGVSEGARLLALQQLMAGVEADVIEERLTKEFGIKDPKPILDWMGIEGHTPAQRDKKS